MSEHASKGWEEYLAQAQKQTAKSLANTAAAVSMAAVNYSAEIAKQPPRGPDTMSPTDFVLWLNGVIDVLDAHPPTQAQWDKMREKIGTQVAAIVTQRIQRSALPYTYGGEADMSAKSAGPVSYTPTTY